MSPGTAASTRVFERVSGVVTVTASVRPGPAGGASRGPERPLAARALVACAAASAAYSRTCSPSTPCGPQRGHLRARRAPRGHRAPPAPARTLPRAPQRSRSPPATQAPRKASAPHSSRATWLRTPCPSGLEGLHVRRPHRLPSARALSFLSSCGMAKAPSSFQTRRPDVRVARLHRSSPFGQDPSFPSPAAWRANALVRSDKTGMSALIGLPLRPGLLRSCPPRHVRRAPCPSGQAGPSPLRLRAGRQAPRSLSSTASARPGGAPSAASDSVRSPGIAGRRPRPRAAPAVAPGPAHPAPRRDVDGRSPSPPLARYSASPPACATARGPSTSARSQIDSNT